MNEKPPSRAEGLVTVQLGAELKKEWVQWCQDRNLVPGKALRSLVEKGMQEGLELTTSSKCARIKIKVAKEPDTGPKVGREIYFTPSEHSAIEATAQVQGFGFHEWVIAATRAALANVPSYGQGELEALTQSNIRLGQVLNELGALRTGAVTVDEASGYQELEASIRGHMETASGVMASGAKRWQLKV